jgi:hypothetical protein
MGLIGGLLRWFVAIARIRQMPLSAELSMRVAEEPLSSE